jgi:hypothetical protein
MAMGRMTSFAMGVVMSLGLFVFSCNPYERYLLTHYNIQAEYNPETASLAANVQMVLVAGREYRDSICFRLNPGVEIRSLAAQELEHYEFNKADSGRLVIFIEEPVATGDQLHISLSYSGKLGSIDRKKNAHGDPVPIEPGITIMDSALYWIPVNDDTVPFTLRAKFALPGNWYISRPAANAGRHGKWLIETVKPQHSLSIIFDQR